MGHEVGAWEHSPETEQDPQHGLWTLSLKQDTLDQIQLIIPSQPKKGHCLCDSGLGSHIPRPWPGSRDGPKGRK